MVITIPIQPNPTQSNTITIMITSFVVFVIAPVHPVQCAMGLTLRLRPLRKRREVLIRIPLTPAPHLDKTHSIL